MINKIHSFKIERYKDVISMFLDGNQIDHLKLSSNKPAFGCGLYFGGNRRAPQNITIKIQ